LILKGKIMKVAAMVLMLSLLSFSFGCINSSSHESWGELNARYQHEEKMEQIKAEGAVRAASVRMNEQDKEQLADMIADRVVEKLKSEQK
jgi:hypothetical protein